MSSIESYYQDLYELVAYVETLKAELMRLEPPGIQATNFDKIGTDHSVSMPTEIDALKLIERRNDIIQRINLLTQRIEILKHALGFLTPFESQIFTRQVIENETFYRISRDLKISERNAKRVKAKALIKLERIVYRTGKFRT